MAWVTAQNELTQAWLATVPAREELRSRLAGRWEHARFGVPFERFKFAAARQAAQRADAPILLRADTSAGHGRGKLTAKAIAEAADRLAFLEGALGIAPR